MNTNPHEIQLEYPRVVVNNGSLDHPPVPPAAAGTDASSPQRKRPDSINIDLIDGVFELEVVQQNQLNSDLELAAPVLEMSCSYDDVRSAVAECISAWESVVEYACSFENGDKERPFQLEVDFRNRPELLNDVGPSIAVAGRNLFETLFGASGPVKELIQSVTGVENHFTIRSKHLLFVPWGLLYSHPEGTSLSGAGVDWMPEGFWGSRHVLDHRIKKNDHYRNIDVATKPLEISLNHDPRIRDSARRPIAHSLKDLLEQELPPIEVCERTSADALLKAVENRRFSEQIAYFFCHQKNQKPPVIILDNDHFGISSKTFSGSAEQGFPAGFGKSLFVFFNTCQGGRVSEQMVGDFASALLRLDANSVFGAHVDVPVVFAKAYAERFFPRAVCGEPFGEIVRDLARGFFELNNPLGLIYSLYRGSTARVTRSSDFAAQVSGSSFTSSEG